MQKQMFIIILIIAVVYIILENTFGEKHYINQLVQNIIKLNTIKEVKK